MKSKSLAIMAAFIMLSAAVFIVVGYSDDSDAALGTYDQKINVFYYDNGWQYSEQESYNLYQAIEDAVFDTNLEPVTAAGNDNWNSGYDPNKNYGIITGINDVSGDDPVALVGYAIKAWDGSVWQDVTNAPLGWIRPHADYGQTVVIPGLGFSASANVAIVPSGQSVNAISLSDLQPLQIVANNNNTLYYFTLHDNVGTLDFEDAEVQVVDYQGNVSTIEIDSSDIQGLNSVVVAGFGTDAYLALIDAIGSNLVSENLVSTTDGRILAWEGHNVYDSTTGEYMYSYDTYYSWMGSVFGVGTHSIPNPQGSGLIYYYWGSFSGSYLSYSFGYYSQLAGAYNDTGSTFQLTYMYS